MQKRKIYFFIGTNAELFKIAPIIREFEKRKIKFSLITSGQTKIHFNDLRGFIKKNNPDIAFAEKKNKSSIYHFLFWGLKTIFISLFSLRREFRGLNKDNSYFIIHGDTVSSLIGGIIAKVYGLTLIHIESGDLSFNFLEPFPEEICRRINVRLADILFPPTDWAKENLKYLKKIKVSTKEDTIVETFLWATKQKSTFNTKKFKKYYVLILHRQEHVLFRKSWSKKMMDYVIKNANEDLNCVLLNHPLTVNLINSLDLGRRKKKIELISQLPYPDFLKLINNAEFLASDGATHQQETYYMGKPLLSLRDYTEQIEGMDRNVVLCKSNFKIIKDFLSNYKKYKSKPITIKVRPSKIIADYLFNAKL